MTTYGDYTYAESRYRDDGSPVPSDIARRVERSGINTMHLLLHGRPAGADPPEGSTADPRYYTDAVLTHLVEMCLINALSRDLGIPHSSGDDANYIITIAAAAGELRGYVRGVYQRLITSELLLDGMGAELAYSAYTGGEGID